MGLFKSKLIHLKVIMNKSVSSVWVGIYYPSVYLTRFR